MAVALAALAFLRGLLAWPALVMAHHRMADVGGVMPGSHWFAHSMSWLPLVWLATVVAAAIAGAIFAVIYNAVTARFDQSRQPT